ncbi:hypothetical protein CTA2_5313 [Colletotrichum tanaceti]|nr:hypothetical protein CTA2_5313 [Colletotrichum tanaceti]
MLLGKRAKRRHGNNANDCADNTRTECIAGFGLQTMNDKKGQWCGHPPPSPGRIFPVTESRQRGRAAQSRGQVTLPSLQDVTFAPLSGDGFAWLSALEPGKNITWSLWLRSPPTLQSPSDLFYNIALELSTLYPYLITYWKGNNLNLIASDICSPPPHSVLNTYYYLT